MNKLNKAIILALHPECKTWEEAVEKDENCRYSKSDGVLYDVEFLPISLSRVVQALENVISENRTVGARNGWIEIYNNCYLENDLVLAYESICEWKKTENGKDLYLEDQSEETKKALSKLFN